MLQCHWETIFEGCDGNLSDTFNTLSNASATSQAVNIGHGQFFNPNLSVSLISTLSAGQDPKTQEILRLREENSPLKRRLRDIIGDSDDDDDEDDGDARKNWSELSRSRKKQLLGKISTQMSKLAGERGTGVENIAASLIARFQIIISICVHCVYLLQAHLDTG